MNDQIFDSVKWEVLPPPDSTDDGMPYATHSGVLNLGGIELECVVLNTGQRLFTGDKIEELLRGITERA